MDDQRQSEGAGAAVAIVVVLGIVLLLAAMVIVGGAMFFYVARSAPAQVAPAPVAPVAVVELILEIDAAGNMTLAGRQVKNDQLSAELTKQKRESKGELHLVIRADKDVEFNAISQVLEVVKTTGITEVSVATKSEE